MYYYYLCNISIFSGINSFLHVIMFSLLPGNSGAKELSLREGSNTQENVKATLMSTPPSRSKSNSMRLKNIVKK